MSVLILKGLQEDFLQYTQHRGKFVLASEWSEAVAHNISCQDTASSKIDEGLKAGIITSVVLSTLIISAGVFLLARYILRVRARFRDVSDYQPPITIPMSKFPEESSVFFRYKPSRVKTFLDNFNIVLIINFDRWIMGLSFLTIT